MDIAWEAWGPAAFERSRRERRPVLLSMTARWCHACHRMDDETWDDPSVVALVERATVPVRVDADARPDVYARYHLGGLPTTALLDERGEFVRGGTYFSAFELQRFLDVGLEDWRSGRRPPPREVIASAGPASLVDEVVARLLRRADLQHGGFGVAPKLPETDALTLLLRRWTTSRDAAIERVVRASLDAIAAHLADPRDGGFFRYAAGADWTGAHTEKVALDQGQIARLLLEAGAALAEPRYVEAAIGGLEHARGRLADDHGRIYASVAADPGYYAGASDEEPAVDTRRFADGSAAVICAAALAEALTGQDLGLRFEIPELAASGAVPHRLDARDGLSGLLRDQALAVSAALATYRLRGERSRLDWSERAAEWAIAHLWDEAASAFRSEPAAEGAMLPPMLPIVANGEMAFALAELGEQSGRAEYRRHAERVVSALAGRAVRSPAGAALALAAQRLEVPAAQAELAGDPADPRARALARAVMAALGPTAVVRWTGGGDPNIALRVKDRRLPPLCDPRAVLEALADLGVAPGGILALVKLQERDG